MSEVAAVQPYRRLLPAIMDDTVRSLAAHLAASGRLDAGAPSLPSQQPQLPPQPHDLYAELEQNQSDLILAGELGKALLEKTNHLSEENEKLVEEFTRDNERLRQENHELRMRLESAEEALECAASEHESEVAALAKQLAERQLASSAWERERADIAEQLAQQNERLSAELLAARTKEDQLQADVGQLRSELRQKRTVSEQLMAQAELLQDENKSLRRRCDQVERDLQESVSERDELGRSCSALEISVASLERRNEKLSEQLQSTTLRLHEHQERMEGVKAELERSTCSMSDSASTAANHSLLEEIELSHQGLCTPRASVSASLMSELESDDAVVKSPTSPMGSSSFPPLDAYGQLRLEVSEALAIMKCVATELGTFLRASSPSASVDEPDCKAAQPTPVGLLPLAGQIRSQVTEIVRGRLVKRLSYDNVEKRALQQRQEIEDLREAVRTLEAEKAELLASRSAKGGSRDVAQELERERDEASERCDAAIAELLRAKNHLMNLENELLETIQKKIKLSQQVELWQVDMEQMVSATVKSQMLREAKAKAAAAAGTAATSGDTAASSGIKKSTGRSFFSRR